MTHTAPGTAGPQNRSLSSLLRSTAAGDRGALSQLYDVLATETYSICAHYLPDTPSRDAAMTEVWQHVWANARALSTAGSSAREQILAWAASHSRDRALTVSLAS